MGAFSIRPTLRRVRVKARKNDKKKINKADISEPQLLSPTQFRRYGNLTSVEKAAMMVQSGSENLGPSVVVPTGEKCDEHKNKEKFYAKKLLDVRRSKRNSLSPRSK